MIVFLNGKFVPVPEARVSVLDPGFLSGWGVFETMRAYKKRIVYLDAHLERIKGASRCIGLNLTYSRRDLKEIIKTALSKSGFEDAYVRLTFWKANQGRGTSVIVKKYRPFSSQKYQAGIKATISRLRQNENSSLAQVKTTNRLLYELSYQEAKARGFLESIILNRRGYITEGTRSNLFFVKDGAIFTPALSCGCLDGITRRVVFDLAKKYNFKISEGNFTPGNLYAAEEVFFTNSLVGVMPVVAINQQAIGKGRCGKFSKFFLKKYNCLLK